MTRSAWSSASIWSVGLDGSRSIRQLCTHRSSRLQWCACARTAFDRGKLRLSRARGSLLVADKTIRGLAPGTIVAFETDRALIALRR